MNLCYLSISQILSLSAQKNNLKHSNIDNLMGKYYSVGENIAWNQQTPEEVMSSWMNSSGHRANIMNRIFNKVGFGKSFNHKKEPYWCTNFGS